MVSELNSQPHRRFNPLTGEWVLVSPHRTQRPWQGKQEEEAGSSRPAYDEHCYLCPGNKRSGGQQNPRYRETFVFTNDFSALLPDTPLKVDDADPLFRAESEKGICKVICFSPRHDLSVPNMSPEAVTRVVEVWKTEYEEFQRNPEISYAQIFENKGAIMGCSNPHPHCQIWASSSIPPIVAREQDQQSEYFEKAAKPLLVDYHERELQHEVRLVYLNDHFTVLVPFWAVWPFETMILPREHCPSLGHFTHDQVRGLADAYRRLTQAYDRVFDCEFPYTAGIHQAPTTAQNHDHWQFHMHFYPPLLRSATVKKFMVGYEMLASAQRDITAEIAADTLRQALNEAMGE
jgi:UDPglucose--hexose-1-phosphate uridylyltransferase